MPRSPPPCVKFKSMLRFLPRRNLNGGISPREKSQLWDFSSGEIPKLRIPRGEIPHHALLAPGAPNMHTHLHTCPDPPPHSTFLAMFRFPLGRNLTLPDFAQGERPELWTSQQEKPQPLPIVRKRETLLPSKIPRLLASKAPWVSSHASWPKGYA